VRTSPPNPPPHELTDAELFLCCRKGSPRLSAGVCQDCVFLTANYLQGGAGTSTCCFGNTFKKCENLHQCYQRVRNGFIGDPVLVIYLIADPVLVIYLIANSVLVIYLIADSVLVIYFISDSVLVIYLISDPVLVIYLIANPVLVINLIANPVKAIYIIVDPFLVIYLIADPVLVR
jgi:hypothetical protein